MPTSLQRTFTTITFYVSSVKIAVLAVEDHLYAAMFKPLDLDLGKV